ncbi:chorismate mutase [Aquibacillus sediminis]|uniref:chorismate mutase n=1 Tax=Aquibacillus sediminis TaxID=2574734 RepID=UPI001107E92E|nr:chorismate mutase [Aquibacillus sediminis]
MIRGIRGATTVAQNNEAEMLDHTQQLIEEMVHANQVEPSDIASVFISLTADLNATFPAKALRNIGREWTYVPVMCMKEIEVPNSLEKCIRVMMTVNTEHSQQAIHHVYHYEAKKLRPDLIDTEK